MPSPKPVPSIYTYHDEDDDFENHHQIIEIANY
jgi:hypothetical protein